MYRKLIVLVAATTLLGCEPKDRRPGLWLDGEQRSFPTDWSFSNDHPEIYVQVASPYLLPHSVTIWCAEVEGALYLGAFDPDSKNWPGWVRDDPEVRLKIGDEVYDVALLEVTDPAQLSPVQAAYTRKYNLDESLPADPTAIRYWRVLERSSPG